MARVSDVSHDPGEPFATVSAAPVAQLQRSRHFLLLFPPEPALDVSRGRWHPELDPEAVEAFLKDAFWVRDHTLPEYNFDSQGNLSFGISDYTDFPKQKYDPDIGIFGMDVNVVLERPGHRVSRRRRRKSRVSVTHRIGREESKAWFAERYELSIVGE
mgnify:CR=1 FL=1